MEEQLIGHYKILRKLGGGGMGVVYEAEDTKLAVASGSSAFRVRVWEVKSRGRRPRSCKGTSRSSLTGGPADRDRLSRRTEPRGVIVLPASTADVQVIVRLAGQHGMSLWPTDQYRTECRLGECSPVREDQVVVDLGKRMNKVLEIDEMLGSPLPNGDRDELECR